MFNSIKNKYKNYIIGYEVLEDGRIKINTTNGNYRFVKNTKRNTKKINQVIVQSKVDIQKRIDGYMNEYKNRIVPFIISAILIFISGAVAISTFFIGSYLLFLFASICFGINIVCISILGFEYIVNLSEIRHLKKVTGYKKEYEFELPKLKTNMFTK